MKTKSAFASVVDFIKCRVLFKTDARRSSRSTQSEPDDNPAESDYADESNETGVSGTGIRFGGRSLLFLMTACAGFLVVTACVVG